MQKHFYLVVLFLLCCNFCLAQKLNHNSWSSLLQTHVSKNGNVNYKGFIKDSVKLNKYLNELSYTTPNETWTENETLAYWINAYNAFTIQLIIRNYPLESIKDLKNPWGKKFITLHGKKYSLNEIEHSILRKMNEPRIHFAINCASISCPKLLNSAYYASSLEEQLTKATKDFFADSTKNTISNSALQLSKLFKWFAKDFKANGSIQEFVNFYTPIEVSPKAKISYLDYQWQLNEQH